jgi:hypothetical protein
MEWKAVGASLDTLAQTMRAAKLGAPQAIAYANSGVLQQAGVVMLQRYIVDGNHMDRKDYTAPPGGTHGPVVMSNRDAAGNLMRNSKGQFIYAAKEKKLFVKGKFVDRSGGLRTGFEDLAASRPAEKLNRQITWTTTRQQNKRGEMVAGIDATGNGYITLSDGYRAAEAGKRGTVSNGVKGVWRALRSVQGRWKTMLGKRYTDLLHLQGAR